MEVAIKQKELIEYVTKGFVVTASENYGGLVCSITEGGNLSLKQDDDLILLSSNGARLLLENLEDVINSIREN